MGEMDDLYRILQVDPIADPEVVEAAYRQLARKYHPDVYKEPDAHRRMQALNDAFAVLRDPLKRAAYDRQRAAARSGSGEAAMGANPPAPPAPTTPRARPPAGREAIRLRRQQIFELNTLVRQIQSEQQTYLAERRRHRTAIGALYLLGAVTVAVLTAALAPSAPNLTTGGTYAILAAAALLAVLGLTLIARDALGARTRREGIARLRRQIRQRRQELSGR